MKFILTGSDKLFIATAPEDITLKQFMEQTKRIVPFRGEIGPQLLEDNSCGDVVDLIIDYDDIRKARDYVDCAIKPKKEASK